MAISRHCLPHPLSVSTKTRLSRPVRLPLPAAVRFRSVAPLRPMASSDASALAIEQRGGKMVAELVGAFNDLTERMSVVSTGSSRLLFQALKLSIPLLQPLPFGPDGRSPLSRALSIACILADLQMDAEVISAGILREVLEVGAITMSGIKKEIGTGTAHLLHESLRIGKIPTKLEILDDEGAAALRKFCLTFYDIRAVILELALKLDMMRNLDHYPKYQQLMISIEVLKIYAPLAHAVGLNALSHESEDLSFRYLFPHSYLCIDAWLRSHEKESLPLIHSYKEELLNALKADPELMCLVDDISIKGRYKSRFSTMKKLLRDGRKPQEVNDLLGLRVVLSPRPGDEEIERGWRACYRTREVIRSLWKDKPERSKDYIARPKKNGYRSLHMAIDVSNDEIKKPLMEIQIRTTEMDKLAAGGTASHSLYKGGFTDVGEAKRLKAIMLAAAELAALRLRDFPSANQGVMEIDQGHHVFRLLDKNGDGRISIEELTEVVEDLGAAGDDARELMQLLDSNSDGSLSSDEFDMFQTQVEFMRDLGDKDDRYRAMLGEKLQMIDSTGLIQVYHKALGDKLIVN
ncbi:hypothetical protein QJS04_geneDACA015802 [Acorus gramineus]|uniref:GTP diphosphokinase n=1 Tax=Acorus gramineus TaxID=55184 RepID=A0AAV9BNQ7_ACOGR|nr:hypothetical protein QJS04_geneDACA015802 [Acorus gramineus]